MKCQGQADGSFDCHRGLKQGCRLSYLLVSILVSHLHVCLEVMGKGRLGVELEPYGGEQCLLLFLEDVVCLSDSGPGLHNKINISDTAADKLRLLINTEKTKMIVFSKRNFYCCP